MQLTTEQRVKKAHITMMKHPETALYSGVFMMGDTEVTDERITAYTDGVNKKYGRGFMDALTDEEVNALVLHENLHIVFRHLLHNRDLFEENRALANMAADYVVNDVIASLKDSRLCRLPKGALWDAKYHNWNMREVYYDLRREEEEKKRKGKGGGDGENGNGGDSIPGEDGTQYKFDEHDTDAQSPRNAEDVKAQDTRVDRALREGALLAGRLGAKIPRSIADLLDPAVRWQDELREFLAATMRGREEMTWQKFNRRMLPNDIYLPSVINETVGEIVVAIDTSGSIGSQELTEFATELTAICDSTAPERVRVLWWDTMVHAQQIFEGDYNGIASMLKPVGGGGTIVTCVPEYIKTHNIKAECVVVFTDGYVGEGFNWDVSMPTLWLVTRNKGWTPPAGRKIVFDL